jgi:hypothetical protein
VLDVGGAAVLDALTAGGTILAALAAIGAVIYIEELKPRRRRPRLKPVFEHGRPEFEATVRPDGRCSEQWLRIRVEAHRDRDAAEDVEILFVAKKAMTSGETRPVEPRNLRWSATTRTFDGRKLLDLLADDAPEPRTRMRLPAGTYRYVDVLQATDSRAVSKKQRRVPRVCTWPFHADRHILGAGVHTLYFALIAARVDTIYFTLVVRWDGKWATDTSWWNRLVVSGPTIVPELPSDI